MLSFDYLLPTKLVFGAGRLSELGDICAGYGRKPLIVTGKSSARTGLLERVTAQLYQYAVFDGVVQNPLSTTVEEGLEILLREDCDMALAVGGGSPMDTAKGIAFMARNDGDINDYIMSPRAGSGALPVVTVSTTAGTGSEANCFAVFTNPVTRDKKSLKDPAIFPKVAVLDPELLTSQPPHVVASTGFDALAHNIEAYIANRSQPIVQILAAKSIRLLLTYLQRVYKNPGDVASFAQVMLASTLGGMSICLAGVGLPHAMEHPVSGLYNVVHGQGLAAVMPAVLELNARQTPQQIAQLALDVGIVPAEEEITDAAKRFCYFIDMLLEELDLRLTLTQLGVREEDLDWLAHNAVTVMYANAVNNPYIPSEKEVRELFEKSM